MVFCLSSSNLDLKALRVDDVLPGLVAIILLINVGISPFALVDAIPHIWNSLSLCFCYVFPLPVLVGISLLEF